MYLTIPSNQVNIRKIIFMYKEKKKLNRCFFHKIRLCVNRYGTIILPVVLYGCETWSLTRREERKLTVFENMVLRRIFGPRRDEVTGNGGDCITRS